jgi:hypothetical protein
LSQVSLPVFPRHISNQVCLPRDNSIFAVHGFLTKKGRNLKRKSITGTGNHSRGKIDKGTSEETGEGWLVRREKRNLAIAVDREKLGWELSNEFAH